MRLLTDLFTDDFPKVMDRFSPGMIFLDNQKNILHANKSFLELFDRKIEDVVGQKCWLIIHPKSPKCKNCYDFDHINLNVEILERDYSLLISSSKLSKDVLLKIIHDVTKMMWELKELKDEVGKLKELVKTTIGLSEINVVCASCHKIRLKDGSWVPSFNSGAETLKKGFSHGQCPDCSREYLKGLDDI